MLVITGALAQEQLATGLHVTSRLTAALAPVAELTEAAAWTSTWTFSEQPVDGDSILPALAYVAGDVGVPEPLRLSWGVVTVGGEYVPLAFRSTTVAGARDEADANATDIRSRYAQEAPLDGDGDWSWWTLEVA